MENSSLEVSSTKTCTKCGETKSILEYSFRKDTQKYRPTCMQCTKGYFTSLRLRRLETSQLLLEGKKRCSKCLEVKNTDDFSIDKYTSTGFSSNCRCCIKSNNKENAELNKKRSAKYRYGVSDEEYNELMTVTNCQICDKRFDTKNIKNIDHCHETGRVRGILCTKCNQGLGMFHDKVVVLEKAITYLKTK